MRVVVAVLCLLSLATASEVELVDEVEVVEEVEVLSHPQPPPPPLSLIHI